MPLAPALLQPVGQLSRRAEALAFDRAAVDPRTAQARLLLEYLEASKDTEFGRLHGFGALATPERFAARLPLMSPEDSQHWVGRLLRGERKLLTAEDPIFYGLTTGSSGHHKYLPITPGYRTAFQRTVKVAFWHLYRRFPRAFRSRLLYFVGPRRFEVAPDGLDVGSMSGYNFTEQPPLVRALYAWPGELFAVPDLNTRSYLALLLAIRGDISLITGVFPLPIISLLRDLEQRAEDLATDLERGTLRGAGPLTPHQQAFFARGPRPDLAARLARAARAPVEEKAALAWPNLDLCYCWCTSTAGSYVPELRRRLGPGVKVRDAIYAATEAWCNVPLGDEETGGPLAITSAYYEFIPEAGGDPVPLEGLRDGARYFIVVTTAAGLYRYVIGDLVEVCGQYLATPRIRFVRKAGASSNLAGEQLDESHVNQAVGEALASLGGELSWFALVGDTGGEQPGYDLLLEPAPGAALSDVALDALGAEVEARLGRIAYNYGLHRGGGRLRALRAVRVPAGSYAAWRGRKVAGGTSEAQLKSVHLYALRAEVPPEFAAISRS
ncbi:MAG: GH3 auxin-responsive promoter family protein [Candidatus Sericytochromatia bacterium]|nr:GH3 auxin-responsive promoter family protein [Candidatus Tanganyikabacteria bacterium]